MAYVNYTSNSEEPWKKSTWVDDGQVSSSDEYQSRNTRNPSYNSQWGNGDTATHTWQTRTNDGKYGSQRSGTSWGEAKGGDEYTGKHGSQPSGSSWGNAKGGIIGGIKGAKGGISGKKKKV